MNPLPSGKRTIYDSAEIPLRVILQYSAKFLAAFVEFLTGRLQLPLVTMLWEDLTGIDLSVLNVATTVVAVIVHFCRGTFDAISGMFSKPEESAGRGGQPLPLTPGALRLRGGSGKHAETKSNAGNDHGGHGGHGQITADMKEYWLWEAGLGTASGIFGFIGSYTELNHLNFGEGHDSPLRWPSLLVVTSHLAALANLIHYRSVIHDKDLLGGMVSPTTCSFGSKPG